MAPASSSHQDGVALIGTIVAGLPR